MITWVRKFLAPPTFIDEERARVANILHTIGLAMLAVALVIAVASPFVLQKPANGLMTTGAVALLVLGMLYLVRRGHVRLASVGVASGIWVVDTLLLWVSGGIESGVSPGYVTITVLAGLLLGGRAAIVFTGLSAAMGLGMLYAENNGVLPPTLVFLTPAAKWLSLTANTALVAVLLYLATRSIDEALRRARHNERALNRANEEMQLEITERKRMQEEMRRSELEKRIILDSQMEHVIYEDTEMRILWPNQAACDSVNLTREELIGRHCYEIWSQRDEPCADCPVIAAMEADRPQSVEKTTPDGRSWFIRGHPVRDANGEVVGAIEVTRDITDRKRVEEEIQQRVGELAALNTLGRRVGATLSLEQVVKAALEEVTKPVNPDLALLFLREGDELILQGASPKETPYAHQETPVHIVGECLCGLAVSEGSTLYAKDIHSDPRCTWEECKKAGLRSFAALPMQSGDEIIGVLGLASATRRDFGTQDTFLEAMVAQITSGLQNALLHEQIQRYAEELEQRVAERTVELEAKNRELETFTYSVSHDLKAPLRGIDGYSRLLLEDHLDQLDEEGRMFLRTIRRATDRMHQLIEDLLAYSRLERRSLTPGRINPQALIESLIAGRAEEIEERGIRVTVDVPCAHVVADADGFTQTLRNLLDNALKFTRETSKPQIEIGGRETEESCILWVRDNGIGFDMKYHDRIFRIFERLHREEDYPGTGVGLAIVHKAMERIGGSTWAESEPGGGAKFYLEIPKRGNDE